MIPRYSRAEMTDIWSDESRFAIWLEVETLALEAMAEIGLAPNEAVEEVKKVTSVSAERVHEIESEVHHDVIAFLTAVTEQAGPAARYLHRGMTSNDLLDTTLGVQLSRSGALILKQLDSTMEALKKRAYEYKSTPCIGRSHGIHAEPLSFGLKLASWYAELARQRKRLEVAIEEVSVGKLSGPVGTYASLPPSIEEYVLSKLGLSAETVATQVVSRDRQANFFTALAQLGGSIERFCVEVRHLQRTEVGEVEEPFGSKQKGSSAMPHKKNPILTENMTGLARLLRSYAITALENVPLWHERDISHSSAERVIGPDACIVTDFLLARFERVIAGLVVHPEAMMRNLDLTEGKIYSGTLLLALVDSGMAREDAYAKVQTHALGAMEDPKNTFQDRVQSDSDIQSLLGDEKIKGCFDVSTHLKYVDHIFERTFNENN